MKRDEAGSLQFHCCHQHDHSGLKKFQYEGPERLASGR
jgi:hypothetical protein